MSRKIKINETGKIEELVLIDPKTGINWIADAMDDCPELGEYDEETGTFAMDEYDFKWWKDWCSRKQEADERVCEILKNIPNDLYYEFQEALCCDDMEFEPEHLQAVCDDFAEFCN